MIRVAALIKFRMSAFSLTILRNDELAALALSQRDY
jgi:hypothetical protein